MAQGIPLSPHRSISFHLPVKISSFFTFLQSSQTQISSVVLPDIWYLYLIISIKKPSIEGFPNVHPWQGLPSGFVLLPATLRSAFPLLVDSTPIGQPPHLRKAQESSLKA
jgi:hypothetical protein